MKREYKDIGFLELTIQEVYNKEWSRYIDRYNELCDRMDDMPEQNEYNIDTRLAQLCRRDIREDGADFMSEPDGIGGRINLWLDELLAA